MDIHDINCEQHGGEASAAITAVDTQAQPIFKGGSGIRGSPAWATRDFEAPGKLARFPGSELQGASRYYYGTDRDRHGASQRGKSHLSCSECDTEWESYDSKQCPDREVTDTH